MQRVIHLTIHGNDKSVSYVSYVVDVGIGSKTSVDAFVYGILDLDLSPAM